jgi:hypothetical protein
VRYIASLCSPNWLRWMPVRTASVSSWYLSMKRSPKRKDPCSVGLTGRAGGQAGRPPRGCRSP